MTVGLVACILSVTWLARDVKRTQTLAEKSRTRSSRCRGLSLVSSIISCMGWPWVGGRDQIWTDKPP